MTAGPLLFSSVLLIERFLLQAEGQSCGHWRLKQFEILHWCSSSGGQLGSLVGGGVGEGERVEDDGERKDEE